MTSVHLSEREAEKLGLKRQHKYRAKRTEIDGIKFASRREANRYSELRMLEMVGSVKRLQLQVRFALTVIGMEGEIKKIGEYVADFFFVRNGQQMVEDAKGFRTPLYRWKKKHFEAQYGIQIQEV